MPYPEEFSTHFLGVGGVVHHDNKILFVKLKYGGAQKFWLIPGGLVEKGESLEEGLIREIKEETNLEIIPDGIIGMRSMVRNSDGKTDVYTIFDCKLIGSATDVKPQESEIADIKWINVDEVETTENMLNYSKIIVKAWKNRNRMNRDKKLDKMAIERLDLKNYEQYWA